MAGKKIQCRVIDTIWVSNDLFRLRFQAVKGTLEFEPGQFLSVVLPVKSERNRSIRRAYSLASGPDETPELFIRKVKNGVGSNYLSGLKPGDEFEAYASFGDFVWRTTPDRYACFIGTGSGLGPIRSMIYSKEFEHHPQDSLLLFGAKNEADLPYPELFDQSKIHSEVCLTEASSSWSGFHGRITDYLNTLPQQWPWHKTDYYLCGSGVMIHDVIDFLKSVYGVSPASIFSECYYQPGARVIPMFQEKPGAKKKVA